MHSFIPVDFDPFEEGKEIEKITFTNEPQREIWLSCIIGGNDANLSYNESVSLEIKGNLHVASFKKAVSNLVLRHEALRATISPNGETLIIYKELPVAFDLEDISSLSEAERNSEFASFLKREINVPLNLVTGPLFRVFLHKTASSEYYFTIIKHHIIGDGWSTGIILEDLSRMYNAYIHDIDVTLDTAAQISDYASEQAQFKLSAAYKETENYWLNQYKDNVPVLDLPTDNPRIAPRSYKGNRMDIPISKEMASQLKAIGAKAGCSLVTTLLAAFEVFLYKETHQRDIVVGLPSSGQAASGLTNVVGHCVNLLPLRSSINPSVSFNDYLKKRKKEVLDAYDHQRLTFGELIKKRYIQRDPSRIPLIPVMFNIDMGMDNAVQFEGLDFKLISNPRYYENFELYLNATGSKKGIMLEWSYNTDLFKSETIRAFNDHYHNILQHIIASTATSIADLAGDAERSFTVSVGKEVHIPDELTFNTLFTNTVERYNGKTAVTFNDESFSYQQLNDKTEQLTAFLLNNGIKNGDIVALSSDRSIEMLVCLLAILRAGSVYLPLDPEYPQERIAFMLADSSAKLLLTSKQHKGRFQSGCREMIIEELWPELKNATAPQRSIGITGNSIAYILYTSGSTGKPKGVQITHKNLVNFLLSMQATPGIKDTDKLLAITSISFDIAGLELYLPIISGAELIIAGNDATKDGRELIDIIEQKKISIMQATPSTWQMMLDSGWQKQYQLKILSGGEALPRELADKLLERCTELWNMYGPTETTIWSTLKQILGNEQQPTIGLPINNTTIYIMDEHGNSMPANQPGEIYIGGEGVAAGYWNRPELTDEKFVSGAYTKQPGNKLYRTGDLGKILDNGEIIYLGRIDHQVKIRGHRIELGEIEVMIARQEGIKQCLVLAREDTPGDKRLIAYVILEDAKNESSWKDRWDTLYEIGAEDKQKHSTDDKSIDGTLLDQLQNSEELNKQLTEWLRTSVERIKELNAKRIYEIGSGAGQILFELALGIEYYTATDYAQTAIDNINKRLAAEPEKWAHVVASTAAADNFTAIGDTSVDLVLINSVAQYFPNADYLITVIKQAVNIIKQGGCIFIGDMQGKNTLEMYHAMDHLQRASDTATIDSFSQVVKNRVRIEEEFVADPAFFYLLPKLIPQITGVDVQLRKGQSSNETTKYHYDVWLYIGSPFEVAQVQLMREWKNLKTIDQIEKLLTANTNTILEVKNIPNGRTAKDHKLLQLLNTTNPGMTITQIRKEVERETEGVHPDVFWLLADKLNYKAHVRWTTDGTDGLFDVVFIPASQKVLPPGYSGPASDIYTFTRTPLSGNEQHISEELIDTWKERLSEALPAYMVPQDFVVLKSFPLTPNAKIDRKALPKPQQRTATTNDNKPVSFTKNERIVTDIWSEILGLEHLKPSDDFFQLGGHSLLAVKVMVAIEKKTGKRLPIATLFNDSTIEKLASQLSDDEPAKKWDALVPIKTTGNKVPIFLIHGGGLNILLFKSIVEYFDDDQPIYGIQALGLNHETDIPPTIELIAKRYVNDILEAFPDGPYALAGYSLGGFLAFEMARQLKEMGKEIKLLGLMDTYAGNNYYVGNKLARMAKKVKRQFNKIPFITRSLIANPKETIDYQLGAVQRKLREIRSVEVIINKNAFTAYEMAIYQKYSDALDAYVLTPFDIEMTLFRVEKRLYFLDDLVYLGWDKFALKGVKIRQVPGDHETFLYPPNSKEFAVIVQAELNNKTSKNK